jgi:hypothetical protein
VHDSVTDAEFRLTGTFAERISRTREFISQAVSGSGTDAEQAGGFGGIVLSRCQIELLAGDPTHLDAFDSPEPLREWLKAVSTFAEAARRMSAG